MSPEAEAAKDYVRKREPTAYFDSHRGVGAICYNNQKQQREVLVTGESAEDAWQRAAEIIGHREFMFHL